MNSYRDRGADDSTISLGDLYDRTAAHRAFRQKGRNNPNVTIQDGFEALLTNDLISIAGFPNCHSNGDCCLRIWDEAILWWFIEQPIGDARTDQRGAY